MPPKGARASSSAAAKSRSSASTTASTSTQSPLSTLYNSYIENTPRRLKVIDAFLVFLMLSGIIQFIYCALITNFPFNSFIAGWVGKKRSYAFLPHVISQICLTDHRHHLSFRNFQLRIDCRPIRSRRFSPHPGESGERQNIPKGFTREVSPSW